MKTKYFVNLIMILLFAFPFVGTFCKMFNIFPIISTLIVWLEILSAFVCMIINAKQNKKMNKNNLLLLAYAIYVIFFMYVFYDVYIQPMVYRKDMLGVPFNDFAFFQSFFFTSLPLLFPILILRNLDCTLFSKFLAIVPTIMFPIYFSHVDYMLYVIYGAGEISSVEMHDENIIGAFSVASYASWAILANITIKGKWHKNKIIDNLIWYLVLIINAVCVIIASKRGPVIYLGVVLFLYYIIYNHSSWKRIVYIALGSLSVLWGLVIFAEQFNFSQGLLIRFMSTVEDGGSNRLGSDFSVFNLAIEQIKQSFWFGSYFRILRYFTGIYPHNFFLETLMTFGVFFSSILYYVVFRVVVVGINLLKHHRDESIIFLMFMITFLIMMSTGTLVNNEAFWIPLILLASMRKNIDYSKNNLINNKK